MSAVVVIESIGTGFDSECHAAGCIDVVKKIKKVDRVYNADSIADAKRIYESDNANFEAESGPGAGYYWNEMVKVYPCAKEKAAA